MHRSFLFALLLLLAALGTLTPRHTLGQSAKPRGRALLVGINEYQGANVPPTPGSVEDAMAMSRLLVEKGWFAADEIKTLVGPQATAANIKQEVQRWLIAGTKPGDRIFFLYSGHGTQDKDEDGDERRTDPTDDKDEALAPYDVQQTEQRLLNLIRDDEINQWLAQMAGRSVVLVFDSCHSGTVSRGGGVGPAPADPNRPRPRYLPTPDQLQRGTQSRSFGGASDYVISEDPASRGLKLVVDKERLTPTAALAVFSAAKSNQIAYSMKTPQGGARGAFSYYLEEALRNGNPPLRELCATLTENIQRAHREGRLKGDQQPDFEISTPSLMNQQPLFPSTTMPSELSLLTPGMGNPASPIKLTAQIRVEDKKQTTVERQTACFGEKMNYVIKTDTPGYLYLLVFSRQDVATVIYPDKGEREQFEAGTHLLEGFPVQAPAGKDVVVILLTKDRLALKEQLDARSDKNDPLNWKQVFDWLGSAELEQAVKQRGQGARRSGRTLKQTEWQATVLVTTAVERCDQISQL